MGSSELGQLFSVNISFVDMLFGGGGIREAVAGDKTGFAQNSWQFKTQMQWHSLISFFIDIFSPTYQYQAIVDNKSTLNMTIWKDIKQ